MIAVRSGGRRISDTMINKINKKWKIAEQIPINLTAGRLLVNGRQTVCQQTANKLQSKTARIIKEQHALYGNKV